MSVIKINLDKTITFLTGLLNTPSPTGYAVEAIEYVEAAFKKLKFAGLTLSRTKKGALLVHVKGAASNAPRGITAHVDTLGLMVKEIKGSGRLKATQLGGYAWNAVEYEGVTIRTADNKRIRGTMLLSNPSTHVNSKLNTTQREGILNSPHRIPKLRG